MAKATEEQKLQLIAKISTYTDRRKWDGEKLQICMENPSFDDRFAVFINSSEIPAVTDQPITENLIIQISNLSEPKFPEWSSGRVLLGARELTVIDLKKIMDCPYFHEDQTGSKSRPTGHTIIDSLVDSYIAGEDKKGMTYQVQPSDAINGHHGLRTLKYLEENWKDLPDYFREWAKGKHLYGHLDVVRNGYGWLNSPYLDCVVGVPYVGWYDLGNQWGDRGPGLHE